MVTVLIARVRNKALTLHHHTQPKGAVLFLLSASTLGIKERSPFPKRRFKRTFKRSAYQVEHTVSAA